MATVEGKTPQQVPASAQSGGILGKAADLIFRGLVIFIYGKTVSETPKEMRNRRFMVVGAIGALLILGIAAKAMLGEGSSRRPKRTYKRQPEQQMLRTAKKYMAEGRKQDATETLTRIVDRYPKTMAARDAKQLLKELEGSQGKPDTPGRTELPPPPGAGQGIPPPRPPEPDRR